MPTAPTHPAVQRVLASAERKGVTLEVVAFDESTHTAAEALTEWECTCAWGAEGGRGCAHVRASVMWLARYWRKAGRKDRADAAMAVLTPAVATEEVAA